MRRVTGNQQGFTLVELMAAVLITVVIVAATMTTGGDGSNRANVVNSQVADTQQNVRLATDGLNRDIKLGWGSIITPLTRPPPRWGKCNATIGAVTAGWPSSAGSITNDGGYRARWFRWCCRSWNTTGGP